MMHKRLITLLVVLIIGTIVTLVFSALPGLRVEAATQSTQPRAYQGPNEHGALYRYVWKISVGEDGYLWFNVAGNFSAAHQCNQPYWARSEFLLNDYRSEAQMQILLSSYLANQQIYVYTRGCTDDGYPIFTKVMLPEH